VIWFGDRPVADDDPYSPSARFTFTDHSGAPILQMDAAAQVIWWAEYEPFGNVYSMRTGESQDQPLRFPGQQVAFRDGNGNEESYNIFRWYRSGWGRYTSADPIGLVAGTHLYAYAAANPVTYVDPYGLISQRDADRMECCELARQIREAWKELRRLLKNERNADKQSGSPFMFWANYSGHLIKHVNYQNRLRKLLKSYDDKNCTDDIGNAREYADREYPDFNWADWRRRFGENIDESYESMTPTQRPQLTPLVPPPPPTWVLVP
jgi:RHS repeat-associated protein